MSTTPSARRLTLVVLLSSVLAACGGGEDAPASAQPPVEPPPPAASGVPRWVSTAAQTDLGGGGDSGIDGPLWLADPAQPTRAARPDPATVDSSSVRIMGGKLDATLSTLANPGPRFVVYDAALQPASPYGYSLYKLALDSSSAPAAQRISTETAICGSVGARFTLIGQNLSGDEALITYHSPDSTGTCAAGGVPKLVKLSMGANSVPIALPTEAAQRITPIGVIHGSSGQVAAVLAWRDGSYVRTDASLGNPVALASADIAGSIDAQAAPTSAGIVTRYGIFIKSADGLRRYDKSTGKVSALLIPGAVGVGAQINDLADEQALYVTATAPGASGALDLYRIADTQSPTAIKLNTDGPLHPWGFRLLKSHVLYAVVGRDDFTAWRKADGVRAGVLAHKRVVMSSTLSDRVFHTTDSATGAVLASSLLDGSEERSLGAAQLLSGALAAQSTPFARSVRGNGAFGHAVVLVPASGQAGLSGASVRWVSFEAAASDIAAGSLPTALSLDAVAQAPGIIGEAGLLALPKTGTSASYLFATQRAAASLVRISNGVE